MAAGSRSPTVPLTFPPTARLLARMKIRGSLAAFLLASAPTLASAFCGFYVSGADSKLFNNATQVVMMRDGMRTVLSMQNNYEGPPESFAMIVPVPVILQKENVRTLPKDLFDKVDKMTAPRLVEYWEQDPCGGLSGIGYGGGGRGMAAPSQRAKSSLADDRDLGVTVEAKFDVGEYDVVILSAKDAGGLDTWLKQEKYKIPEGAEPYLKPYVTAGSKFFVAKVDPKRVTFEKGQAALSPLRFHYDAQDFTLPVRLGLINSKGTQDLVVNILATERYEPANYPSVTIPTNIDLAEGSKDQFGRFYAALFDKTLEKNPKAVVTEYSWNAGTCDPCPGPTLTQEDFATLGADTLPGASETPIPRVSVASVEGKASTATQKLVPNRYLAPIEACWQTAQSKKPKTGRVEVKVRWNAEGKVTDAKVSKNETNDASIADCVKKPFENGLMPAEEGELTIGYQLGRQSQAPYKNWTLTRLHARYSKEALGADLVFKAAGAIMGGREVRDEKGNLEHGFVKDAGTNNFQGRYAIRHPWVGPIECKEPHRGVWGGPWYDPHNPYGAYQPNLPTAAEKTAFAPRGNVQLTSFVRSDVPELDLKAGKGPLPELASPTSTPPVPGETPAGQTTPAPRGCGSCSTTNRGIPVAELGLAFAALAFVRRRRRG